MLSKPACVHNYVHFCSGSLGNTSSVHQGTEEEGLGFNRGELDMDGQLERLVPKLTVAILPVDRYLDRPPALARRPCVTPVAESCFYDIVKT